MFMSISSYLSKLPHITPLQAPTAPYHPITCPNRPTLLSITCPNRPTLLHYLPQPPHITPLHAQTAPHYSIQSPIFVNILQPLPPPHPYRPTAVLSSLCPSILSLSLSLSLLPFFSHYAGWFRRKDQYFVRWCHRSFWWIKSYERVSIIRNVCRGKGCKNVSSVDKPQFHFSLWGVWPFLVDHCVYDYFLRIKGNKGKQQAAVIC